MMLERHFLQQIIQLAEIRRWRLYHVTDVHGRLRSETSVGFPDLILCRDARLIAAENKTGSEVTTHEQRLWLMSFDQVGAEVVLWRPDTPPEKELWTGLVETSYGDTFGAIGKRLA